MSRPTRIRKTLIALVLACIVLLFALYWGCDSALNLLVKPDFQASRDIPASYDRLALDYPKEAAWADSLKDINALRDTFITASDGRRLHALYAAAAETTPQTAVIVHGWGDNAVKWLAFGYMYNHQLGYNILLPDLHAHGLSDGETARMGWLDRLDVLQWMDVANNLFTSTDSLGHEQPTSMVLHGISMGAATIMCVSGETLPSYVKAFVEDCGYTNVLEEVEANPLSQGFKRHFIPLLSWLCKQKYGWSFTEASPLDQVAGCALPMFFIHGDADDFVPTRMVYPLYEAKPSPKEIWLAPESAHAKAYKDYPEEYTQRVMDFLNKYVH